jgi:hypothetical protein
MLLALWVAFIGTNTGLAQTATLRVGNLVWVDTNNNGIKDTNESGVPGLTMQLWSAGTNGLEENGAGDDTRIGSEVVTDLNGNYQFSNVPAGVNYYVRIPSPPGNYLRTSGGPGDGGQRGQQ